MPWTELAHASQAYVHVHVDRSRSLVRLTRSTILIPKDSTRSLLEQFSSELGHLLPHSGRSTQRLLFDTREAPKLADAAIEAALLSVLHDLLYDFQRLAILIKTPIGALQMRRILREANLNAELFYDEAEAIVYLAKSEH